LYELLPEFAIMLTTLPPFVAVGEPSCEIESIESPYRWLVLSWVPWEQHEHQSSLSLHQLRSNWNPKKTDQDLNARWQDTNCLAPTLQSLDIQKRMS